MYKRQVLRLAPWLWTKKTVTHISAGHRYERTMEEIFGEKIRKAATRYTQKASESTRQRKGTANHRPFRIGVRKAKRARRCTKGIRL